MHQTHNDFGQALAPWSDRWEAARRIRAMRQRILGTEHKEADDGEGGGNDEKGKTGHFEHWGQKVYLSGTKLYPRSKSLL